jgi:small multidrug resistance pump
MLGIHGLALLVALVLNAVANILIKVGSSGLESGGGLLKDGPVGAVRAVLTSPALLVGLTCFGLNAAFYMFALQSRELKISIAYPIMVGGGYAIIAAVGFFVLGEHMNTAQKIGVALILGGVILVASQSDAVA